MLPKKAKTQTTKDGWMKQVEQHMFSSWSSQLRKQAHLSSSVILSHATSSNHLQGLSICASLSSTCMKAKPLVRDVGYRRAMYRPLCLLLPFPPYHTTPPPLPSLSSLFPRPRTTPPLRKKLYSSRFSLPEASKIFAHIWNENNSLCFSNRPLHVYLGRKGEDER